MKGGFALVGPIREGGKGVSQGDEVLRAELGAAGGVWLWDNPGKSLEISLLQHRWNFSSVRGAALCMVWLGQRWWIPLHNDPKFSRRMVHPLG